MSISPRIAIRRHLASIALVLLTPAFAQAQLTSYTWTGTEPTMSSRLSRDGIVSSYDSPKVFPGVISLGPYSYTTFTFTNPLGSPTPFFVTPVASGDLINMFFSAYAGSFDPTNLALNYLGDAGLSCTSCGFSVMAPIGNVVVVVNGTAPGAGASFAFETSFVTATPEPTSLVLMATGLVSVVGAARRRRAS